MVASNVCNLSKRVIATFELFVVSRVELHSGSGKD